MMDVSTNTTLKRFCNREEESGREKIQNSFEEKQEKTAEKNNQTKRI